MIRKTVSYKKLGGVKASKLIQESKKTISKYAKLLSSVIDELITDLKKYPKKRPKQKYVRTFTFQKSWRKSKTANGFMVSNNAKLRNRPYPKYVVGNAKGEGQNQEYHAGRWYLFIDKVKAAIAKFSRTINKG